jgi:hypothetical protein
MNISLNCKLSLSKKLRAILGKEASVTLVSQDIVDGKGTAIITLTSDEINDIKPEEIGETSIMLIPIEISEESPNSASIVHGSIFSTIPSKHQKEQIVDRLAVTHAPDKGDEPRAVKQTVEVPEVFSSVNDPECKEWVSNMSELVEAMNTAKGKKSEIDLDSAQNDREKLILRELKEKEEAIDIPTWIVNDKCGMLSVNDLNISLPLNSPYDLSNISAKRIANSKDLKGLLKSGYIRFISPEEKDRIIENVTEEEPDGLGLGIYDNHEQAMENIGSHTQSSTRSTPSSRNPVINDNDENAIEINDNNAGDQTEDESMILNLTKNLPTSKSRITREDAQTGNRTSTHGNKSNKPVTQPQTESKVRTIRKLS